jgi:protease-4
MAQDTDSYFDRRRLKRRLTFWRLAAIVAVAALAIVAFGQFDSFDRGDHVAIFDVDGIIVDDPRRDALLNDVAEDPDAKALIVRINSPGGTVVGGESLYLTLRDVAKRKPVVAVLRELATSAGYMAAISADHIVARQSTITGSIGVLLQTTDVTELLSKIGVKPEVIKSSPLKAQPNPMEKFSPEAREATEAVIKDMYEMFVSMVSLRRNFDGAKTRELADGRIFTGRQALINGLVDVLGGVKEARVWLESNKGVAKSLPLLRVALKKERDRLRDILEDVVGKTVFSERLRLDGLISLWHPNVK